MKIAILALQGAFAEHEQMLHRLGIDSFLIRNLSDWQKEKDGLILPGGESTAMMKIMSDEGFLNPITEAIRDGLPVFGTCAGMILLDDAHLGCMNISVKRNAYGRQLGSFYVKHKITLPESDGEKWEGEIPMTFIRAPYIERVGDNVKILSSLDSHIIAARQDNMLAVSFHPELNNDEHLHRYFVHSMIH